jgi:hypothetical protein
VLKSQGLVPHEWDQVPQGLAEEVCLIFPGTFCHERTDYPLLLEGAVSWRQSLNPCQPTGTLILDFLVSRAVKRYVFVLYDLTSLRYFVVAAQTD